MIIDHANHAVWIGNCKLINFDFTNCGTPVKLLL